MRFSIVLSVDKLRRAVRTRLHMGYDLCSLSPVSLALSLAAHWNVDRREELPPTRSCSLFYWNLATKRAF
jgi:hypothetical protein